MFTPKQSKYRKFQKNRGTFRKKWTKGGAETHFGDFALKASTFGCLTPNQMEATRRVLRKQMRKAGKIWIRVFPNHTVTKKPSEVRMGKGKGVVDHWNFRVHPGRILFEVSGVSERRALQALDRARAKLPLRTKICYRLSTMNGCSLMAK